ncbi:alpha/beta-hydrolase family protein [Actinoplanes sp. NEAU-A12]|uniref:Alpha/beta-hydrolase family protein n=1 Tax=Actinoplanes sandaracinus TaxID=3045177 RepID=A0ABT6WTY7_9ACTN|nr:alpha/beta-hydrolase family protein [Actinoplanes sandaracinus]MDI6103198.1 alpha/beta-hydrolase family protein [Actinoplanes sandaracinus]
MRRQVVAPPPGWLAPLRTRIPAPRRSSEQTSLAVVAPRSRRRIVLSGLSLTGAGFAALFYCLSFTPSLLPRAWFLQGVVAGITAAMGYALGATAGALVRRFRGPFRSRTTLIAWGLLAVAVPVLVAVFLWLGTRWQRDLRVRLGMPPAPEYDVARTVGISLLTFGMLLLIARLLRLATYGCAWLFRRIAPDPAAYCAGTLVVAVLAYGAFDGLLVANLFAMADRSAAVENSGTGNGVTVPSSALRSGGPQSLVPWDTLGRQGRAFVAGVPTGEELSKFAGRPAAEPIRVYAGLTSADTLQERAALVVREMERTGAFDRAVVAVVTPTGTGWVDNRVTRSLEYMYAGDSALVSMQYSYLPSFFAFMGNRSEVVDAADALIGAVRARWAQLPPGDRPRLLLFGESLGTYGMEKTFGTPEGLVDGADGALLLGPTFANPTHRLLTERRAPGSPIWDPTYPGLPVEFADDAAELRGLSGPRPKVVYLQNATDPVVWWSWDLLWQKPTWLTGKRAPDVTPDMHWYPGITFWQITCDLVFSNKVPTGHGHSYKSATVDGWAAIAPPPGWTFADSVRLRALLDG